MKIYSDTDADLAELAGRVVAIIGYGNQGRAQALNLRDSGVTVLVGSIRDDSFQRAAEDGFEPVAIDAAAARADVVLILIPDEVQPGVYREQIAPQLVAGNTVVFAHGYNVRFEQIVAEAGLDVVMVAPRMVGKVVRDLYVQGSGAVAYVGVHQDATGNALPTALAIAKGIGATRAAVIEQSFADETDLDLAMEQVVDAAIYQVLIAAFETFVENGFDPAVVAMEMYASKELAETAREMADIGFFKQMFLHSQTSQYGSLSRGERALPSSPFKRRMARMLREIRRGQFAREWAAEQEGDYPVFERLRDKALAHPLNQAEARLKEIVGGMGQP